MGSRSLRERLIDPNSPDRSPRRAAYALPTLFTAGNVFLGFYAILETFQGVMTAVTGSLGPNAHFERAALAIGAAVFADGLDGRIARMTNTTSEFGKEIDSLADVITFGIAPAVLAYAWGVQFVPPPFDGQFLEHLRRVGYFISFLYLLCGAARLARFNVQKNPVLKNPGRPDRKYFAGLAIPAAAAMIAAIIYAMDSVPVTNWVISVLWLGVVGMLAFLMVSTWRYPSFKELHLGRPRSPLTLIAIGSLIYLIWNYSQPVLLALTITYVGSGIAIRVGGIVRRRMKSGSAHPEHQVG
jgi:CDP-diacylglycerol---serine O-phosphatidyltransferase